MNAPTVTVPAAELQDLFDQAARLATRISRILDRAGVDVTGATEPAPVLPGDVTDLDAYRTARMPSRRRAAST